MLVSSCIGCKQFPCEDVVHSQYCLPEIEVDPDSIRLLVISEAAPKERADYYYSGGQSLFEETTLLAFQDAGAAADSIWDLVKRGMYFTTAVKCGKTGYGIMSATIRECSHILEEEMALFPNVEVLMLMGDVAIKAVNYIAKRQGAPRVIPAGSTYKIRDKDYYFQEIRAFPSYLQAGPSFFIEKSKRKMIAEDLTKALQLIGLSGS